MNKFLPSLACGWALVLACPCGSTAYAKDHDGTGFIDCHATYTLTSDFWNESGEMSYEFEIQETKYGYELIGTYTDHDDDEEFDIGPDPVKLKKRGKRYEARSEGWYKNDDCWDDNCPDIKVEAKFKYPRDGGKARFEVRLDNGHWEDMLNVSESFEGISYVSKGSCEFTPND